MSHVSFHGPGLPAGYDPVHKMAAAAYSHTDHADCNHQLDGLTPVALGDTLTYTCRNCFAHATFKRYTSPARWPERIKR
jgi:hypothetical protein